MYLSAQELEAQMPDATKLLSDEPEMESSLHYGQLALLVSCLEWLWRSRDDFFIGANLTIYFSRQELRNRDFRGPDFFLVKNIQRRDRSSWVVWEEGGKYPDLIIELLSDSTARVDRGVKKDLYQNRFRTPEYFWFNPEDVEFAGFRLVGEEYQAIVPDSRGWLWSEVLGLYLGVQAGKLRYFTPSGSLVPTLEEAVEEERLRAEQERLRAEQERRRAGRATRRAEQERQQAEQERLRAEQERLRAEQEREQKEVAQQQLEQERLRAELLAEQLRSLGINPDS